MFVIHKNVEGWQVDRETLSEALQRHSNHNELKDRRLPCTRQQQNGRSSDPFRRFALTYGIDLRLFGKIRWLGKIHGADNPHCWFCWVSHRVYFKRSRSWNSHKRTIRGKSELRSRTRQASRDLITSVTASDGKPFQMSFSNNNFKEKWSLKNRRMAVQH